LEPLAFDEYSDRRFDTSACANSINQGRDAWRKFTEIYGNPRATTARVLCIEFFANKYTVALHYF
jgi:hypothetical protein